MGRFSESLTEIEARSSASLQEAQAAAIRLQAQVEALKWVARNINVETGGDAYRLDAAIARLEAGGSLEGE